MKRIRIFLLIASFMLLPGCSGQKALTAQDIDFVFSCKADVVSPNGNFTCAVNRAGRRDASVAILSGSGSGLKWDWNGNGFHLTYLGLSAESEACTLPDKSFASTLVDALDCAEQPDALKSVGDNVFSGSMDGSSFTVTADGNTGEMRTLSVPSRGLTATFRNFGEPSFSSDSKSA